MDSEKTLQELRLATKELLGLCDEYLPIAALNIAHDIRYSLIPEAKQRLRDAENSGLFILESLHEARRLKDMLTGVYASAKERKRHEDRLEQLRDKRY
ncbi:MAG: hypothetical protein FWE21_09060 [Defluviitaleaceae bacterium]|nr:hypothetical protein [Defluviitaleaceae bacterium]